MNWLCCVDADKRRVHLVGDVKNTDLLEKYIFNLKYRPRFPSMKEKFDQADTFIKTLKRIKIHPGDWHAGLTMLQAIMKIFWDTFL